MREFVTGDGASTICPPLARHHQYEDGEPEDRELRKLGKSGKNYFDCTPLALVTTAPSYFLSTARPKVPSRTRTPATRFAASVVWQASPYDGGYRLNSRPPALSATVAILVSRITLKK